ncbi:uncharacterized protein K02A2.6 [Nephila pilipes]|uniref:Uncharacterized protein K02A2.6 n=1 Tax=Nephila pilipes TaxID=299642 RepID=A0A8X6NFR2_NEPPI|nr:uncharacterized protein K02A2.6 [Nephila pilipes]
MDEKELLIDFYVRELLKLVLSNAIKKKQDSLSILYNKLSTQLRALSSLGVTTDQCAVILYPLVESSLPTHILRSFERQRKNIDSEQSISTLDAIVSFLKSEVQSEEKIKFSRSEILASENRKYLAESQRSISPSAELFIQESNDTFLTWIIRREQWSVFVTNRISEIRKLTTWEDWLHISTDQNAADILSRGCGPKQLQKCKWWQGPAWLQNPKEQWPKSAINIDEKEVEIEKRKSVISANNTELESISLQLARRFSRYSKMIRVLAWVLRFQPKAKGFRKYTELTNEELLNAQKIIFRVVQKECYSNEETRKNLRGLQVFEDEEGILRLKSRLINEEESKYFISSIILPSRLLADIPLNNVSDLDQIEKTNIVLRWRYIQKVRENLKQRAALAARKSTGPFAGKDGIIRLVKLRIEKGNVLRPIQQLYPFQLKPNYEQVVSENRKVPEVVTEYPELNTDSYKIVPVTSSGREIKLVKRLDL